METTVLRFSRAFLLLDQLPSLDQVPTLEIYNSFMLFLFIFFIFISEPKIIQHADVMATCIILIACHSRNYYTFTTSISACDDRRKVCFP